MDVHKEASAGFSDVHKFPIPPLHGGNEARYSPQFIYIYVDL